MRRGFKTQAENQAVAARKLLGIAPQAPFDSWAYAAHLKVLILDLNELGLTAACVRQLTVVDPSSWSAMTLKENDALAIVLNTAHTKTRQNVDLMHELAHLDLKHTPARVDVSETGMLLLSDYSDEQEQEADWYAAAFLLPRDGILRLRARGKSADEIAEFYGVSKALTEMRLRMTGVEIQLRRSWAR